MNAVALQKADLAGFHIATLIKEAAADRERAAMLLRLPDEVVWDMGGELINACGDASFPVGVQYLVARIAGASAVRDECGRMPELMLTTINSFRRALCDIAGVRE